MKKVFHPAIIDALKGYKAKDFAGDFVSGLIVAVIALPLSIALALASGVGPEEGLYTAIIAGFIISALGGSRVQIAGPTAAFATIVAGIVAENGKEGLMMATVMAGILLIIMGLLKLGSLIKFIPAPITTGFTAGIAVTILVGQLKDFFGLTYPAGLKPIETTEKIAAVFQNISTINWCAVGVGCVSLAILIFWPKVSKKIPGSLIAVVVGALLVKFLKLPVNTIGDLYTVSSALPKFQIANLNLGLAVKMAPDAFTIAVLAAIESLLSAVVADGMTGYQHHSNTELIAQGVGNIGSALFGGIPATGAIARTAANINNGGKSPISGMVHAVILLLVLVLLMPLATLIPMPTIAAVLFLVAYNMCQWRPFVRYIKSAPKQDCAVLIITFILTIVFDLVVAIGAGIVMACVLFMKRMSDETDVRAWTHDNNDESLRILPDGIEVFEIEGPLFFGSVEKLTQLMKAENAKVLVLRMRSVTALDATALKSLREIVEKCKANGTKVVFSHVNAQPWKAMEHSGLISSVGEKYFCPHIEEAIELAESLAHE